MISSEDTILQLRARVEEERRNDDVELVEFQIRRSRFGAAGFPGKGNKKQKAGNNTQSNLNNKNNSSTIAFSVTSAAGSYSARKYLADATRNHAREVAWAFLAWDTLQQGEEGKKTI